jgi:hypothetical protein
MTETMLIFIAGVVTGLAISLIVELVRHLLALRRDRIIREREQQQRNQFQIQRTTLLRRDEWLKEEERYWNPQYLLLRFTIDNVGDSPKLLTQLRIQYALREAGDLAYLLTLIEEKFSGNHQPPCITDRFPYTRSFDGKISVQLIDASSRLPVDLTTPVRIDSRDKLWISVLMKTTDDWRQSLRASNRLIRYLTFRFVIDDQQFIEVRVDVHNKWGAIESWDADIEQEVDRLVDISSPQ